MIPVQTKIEEIRAIDNKIVIRQKIISGPDHLLDRRVTLIVDAKELIKQLPVFAIEECKDDIKKALV